MKRTCSKAYSSSDFNSDLNKHIYIDDECYEELFNFIERKLDKSLYNFERVLTNQNSIFANYEKEKIDEDTGNVTAFKYRDGDNSRIYCQEVTKKGIGFIIICAVLLEKKKVQKNNNKIKNIIRKISKYEYEIEK